MRGISAWTTSTLLAVAALVTAHGEPNLKHEHAGDVFRKLHRKQCYLDGPASNGSSTGEYRTVEGADAFSKAGYLTIIPDLFRGDPVPANALSDPNFNFNISEWQTRHPASEIESIITSTLQTTTSEYGIAPSKIGAVGYCFGGKYVAKYLSSNSTRGNTTFAAGFTAHPSNTLPSEWEAIENPISIAFGELDASSTPENRTNIEGIFIQGNKTFQTNLYADAEHGFAVRTNLTDPKKRFAQESAYLQAVRWFDQWVKGDEDDE
ncbi:hypothetical protein CBER1_05601 [Cercospora berteroae]|uniref:Dienelactone hydrolase domain-containing protein n=1 Tax=Cercospora berteroae TaxID=357750 RepID=A0A2S6CFH7_9PEZI|nr:hypothetical protein CBER1_05601 [Cercospora berteroae]